MTRNDKGYELNGKQKENRSYSKCHGKIHFKNTDYIFVVDKR